MSAPNIHVKVLPFEARVQLVRAEISKRTAQAKPEHKNSLQARLWVHWLKREVLV